MCPFTREARRLASRPPVNECKHGVNERKHRTRPGGGDVSGAASRAERARLRFPRQHGRAHADEARVRVGNDDICFPPVNPATKNKAGS